MAALRDRIFDPRLRLVTLTGPGGVGKSRLGAAVFDELVPEFAGGHFLDLRDATTGEDVMRALGAAVGLPPAADPPTAAGVVEELGPTEFLLAIDHCERVTDAVSPLVSALIAGCPRLRVLVLSGEPLRIYGEWLFRLAPLAVPGDISIGHISELERIPSVQLFIDRALAVREGFALTPENQAAISELCARLDGLPLAIELAAARMKMFTPRAILAEVDRGLDILQTNRAGTSSRHHAMRDAIAFTCDRLREEERALFARLAVFTSGFPIAAARLVAGPVEHAVVELLETLVDKNLLLLREQLDGELSFAMLSTTRAYASELLERGGQLEDARRGHADYYFGVALGATSGSQQGSSEKWLRRLSACQDDVHSALDYLVARNDADRAAALAVALRPYWLARALPRDGLGWIDRALLMPELSRRAVADLLEAKGELAAWLDDDDAAADGYLAEAAAIYESLHDGRGVAACQRAQGVFYMLRSDMPRAEKLLKESIDGFTAAGERLGAAVASFHLATLLAEVGEFAAAAEVLTEAQEVFRTAGDPRHLALSGLVDAVIMAGQGDPDSAERQCREVVRELDDLGERLRLVPAIEILALLLTRHHRSTACWRKATLLLAAATALRDDTGHRATVGLAERAATVITEAKDRLGEDAFVEIWADGSALSPRALVVEALTPVSTEAQISLSRTTDSSIPLTARELEVAELVSAGLTNRQVARRLGIAEWTVVNHLRKIMRKLDCSSRVEVARWLMRQRTAESGARG